MSFELHVYSDRQGRTKVAVTTPEGKRLPGTVLSLHSAIDLGKLLTAVVDESALNWLSAPHEEDPVRPEKM